MPENNDAPDALGRIRVGNVSGTMIVGDRNIVTTMEITAEYGSNVTVHAGPLPDPVKRRPISQLPRSGADPLIGREPDVSALRAAIEARKLVQVWGASGVGKSALLRHLARTTPGGPEGTAYIEAGGRTADDIAQAIFDVSFDAPNYKPSLEVLKEHLKTLQLRIYLDDTGLDERDLRRLFDLAEQSTFVFASQQPSTVGGVHAIRLKGLTAPAAAELVATLLGRELRPDEELTVAALCVAVDGNPLKLRRIASSAATGKGLPGIADLPELLPALVHKLRPEERDLLHLLASLAGAELAPRHLNALLGRPDADALADGLVRHGLLLASETGYSCPPDVAEHVLTSRATEFPADRLCRELTAWVQARDTTPDDVAAHLQALDIAVLRAERGGHAELGVALARAASPKLALSGQFDAWGSLLGAGWAAARHAGDKKGEEFFLREARNRRMAIGRGALTTALVLEAEVLWRELTVMRAHSAVQQVANAGTSITPPVQAFPTTHVAGNPQALIHPTLPRPFTPPPTHPTPAKLVVDLSRPTQQPPAAPHLTGAHPAPQIPKQIDFSQAHTPPAHSTHAVSTTTTATSTGHTTLTATGAATVKSGISALVIACSIGFVAVLGVGATVYVNDQPNVSPVAASDPFSTPASVVAPGPVDTSGPVDSPSPSPTFDPVCATVVPALQPEIQQFNTDGGTESDAVDSYNSAMDSYNSGDTSTAPDDSAVVSDLDAVIGDLNSIDSTLQSAQSQAQDSSLETDLNDALTSDQQTVSQFQSFESDVESAASGSYDTSSETSAVNSALSNVYSDCGD
jgi:hypothetical protein